MGVFLETFALLNGLVQSLTYLSSHPDPVGRVIHGVDQLDRDNTGSCLEKRGVEESSKFHPSSSGPEKQHFLFISETHRCLQKSLST